MVNNYPRVDIVILNWNGWQDTIECLASIQDLNYPNFRVVLIDNGSTDNSLQQIKAWASGELTISKKTNSKPMTIVEYDRMCAEAGGDEDREKDLELVPSAQRLIIIPTRENLGFARGCNVGIRYAMACNNEYVWLLNNDTVVAPDALEILVAFMNKYIDYVAVTPQIRYYNQPHQIWNCGGNIKWFGVRKYNFADQLAESVPQNGYEQITFATGCALLIRMDMVKKVGMLSEKFFFGEEDFEWGLRLKKMSLKQACCYNAIIYHKVGQSISSTSQHDIQKAYGYYLNRFINLRTYYSFPFWQIWRHLYIIYIFYLLKSRYKTSWPTIRIFLRSLLSESRQLQGVDKDRFDKIMKSTFLGVVK